MSLMDLRGREKGLETTDTKETSLRDRYFSKSSRTNPSEDATHNKNSLKRDTHVVLEREGTGKEMHYRVLSASTKYYNKWYMPGINDDPPELTARSTPDAKLTLQLLEKGEFQGEEGYSPVREFSKYTDSEVYPTTKAKEIKKVMGMFECI